jgi:hypothetical protein
MSNVNQRNVRTGRSKFVFAVFFSIASAGFALCGRLVAQEPQSPHAAPALPEFEVASVKPTPPDNLIMNALLTYPGGRIVAKAPR